MKEQKTFLEIRGAEPNLFEYLTDLWLTAMPHTERIAFLANTFLFFAERHLDQTAEKLFGYLMKAYQREEYEIAESTDHHLGNAYNRAMRKFGNHIRELFLKLPDKRQTGTEYGDSARGYVPRYSRTLPKTKNLMLQHISNDWIAEPTEESKAAFRFLLAAVELEGNRSPHAASSGKRMVFQEETAELFQLVREHLEHKVFKPEHLEVWLQEKNVPWQIQNMFLVARVRAGGTELFGRDLRNKKLLEEFDPDKRSEAAIDLLGQRSAEIAALDAAVQELLKRMRPEGNWWDPKMDKIGESEYVSCQKIAVDYVNISTVSISVQLKDNCSEALGRDIFGRVRRHIQEWHKDHPSLLVSLNVCGGEVPLNLFFIQEPEKTKKIKS